MNDWDPKNQLLSNIDLISEGKTLLKPFDGKNTIGLNEVDIDFSMDVESSIDSVIEQ